MIYFLILSIFQDSGGILASPQPILQPLTSMTFIPSLSLQYVAAYL